MITVRDGKKVWPTCPECGCRLDIISLSYEDLILAQHFFDGHLDKDARGCICPLVNETWYGKEI
jgi:hypothetical protein